MADDHDFDGNYLFKSHKNIMIVYTYIQAKRLVDDSYFLTVCSRTLK